MSSRTVEVHAELQAASPAGPAAWMACVGRGRSRGLFAFGPSMAGACQALAEQVSLSINARPGRPVRAARVWADALYCHDGLEPQRTVTLPAAVLQSPLGEWLATIRPNAGFPGEVVSVGDSPATAVEDLAVAVADAYASGAVPGAAAAQTRVRLVFTRPMTGKVRLQRTDEAAA